MLSSCASAACFLPTIKTAGRHHVMPAGGETAAVANNRETPGKQRALIFDDCRQGTLAASYNRQEPRLPAAALSLTAPRNEAPARTGGRRRLMRARWRRQDGAISSQGPSFTDMTAGLPAPASIIDAKARAYLLCSFSRAYRQQIDRKSVEYQQFKASSASEKGRIH